MADKTIKEKALLDTEELEPEIDSPASVEADKDKVELDLDDAPFLDEDIEEPEPQKPSETAAAPEASGEESPKKPPLWKQEKVLIAGGGGLLLVIGVAAFFLLKGKKPAEPKPDPPKTEAKAPAPAPPPPPPVEVKAEFEPFIVELKTDRGEIRFLTFRFAVVTTNPGLVTEINAKKTKLRDAVYYYLKNKNLTFLADKSNQQQFKNDILSVLNQYIVEERVVDFNVEEFIIK